MLFDALAYNAMSDKTAGFRASHPDRLSSVITYTNLFVYLITGETSSFSFFVLAATYSPTPSPVQYHRPLRS